MPTALANFSDVDLLDINVWLALVDENHSLHSAAVRYWQEEAGETVAFCRVSMLGFLRLSTQRRILSRPLLHEEAWLVYRKFLSLAEVRFLSEPEGIEEKMAAFTRSPDAPHHLWTDAYLAAFAVAAGCRLVSFDGDFARFVGLDFLHLKP